MPVTHEITGSNPVASAIFFAAVAQPVEQRTENPRVGGSSPPCGTTGTPQATRLAGFISFAGLGFGGPPGWESAGPPGGRPRPISCQAAGAASAAGWSGRPGEGPGIGSFPGIRHHPTDNLSLPGVR
ncbi:protein of unknown function [Candidatus Hydrogenisulfobacillus filiaventi]|uniref:Uncharacterized protein n=1 Tax=Candidatus Hydrogenisulfobacillus filiaventi TaxID=2707344 RepID=A0A6F8ZED6_9FIRM|nr:protein of unknown function [Candidatus Hydrogenisulfobacillus filiaventi]